MKDRLSIKEFSQLSRIADSTLRYWDKIDLFPPGIRSSRNRYRYYTPSQMIDVNYITVLSDLRVPLKTIIETESSRTPAKITDLLSRQEKVFDLEIRKLNEAHALVHTRRELINEGMKAKVGDIAIRAMEETPIVLGRPNIFRPGELFYLPLMRFREDASVLRVNLNFPIGGRYASMETFLDNPSQPERFFSVDPHGSAVIPADNYLVAYSQGYYGDFGDVPKKMADYARNHGFACVGSVYIVYLFDEVCEKDPSQYLSRVSVAVVPQEELNAEPSDEYPGTDNLL